MTDNSTMDEALTPEEAKAAHELSIGINTKAKELLYPMIRAMITGRWAPEMRAIMWNAVATEALRHAQEAISGLDR